MIAAFLGVCRDYFSNPDVAIVGALERLSAPRTMEPYPDSDKGAAERNR